MHYAYCGSLIASSMQHVLKLQKRYIIIAFSISKCNQRETNRVLESQRYGRISSEHFSPSHLGVSLASNFDCRVFCTTCDGAPRSQPAIESMEGRKPSRHQSEVVKTIFINCWSGLVVYSLATCS